MLSFKCKNCAGEMSVSRIGALQCPYCGAKNFFNDSQFEEYKKYRQRMLEYLSAAADERLSGESTEKLWDHVEKAVFKDEDGMDITIEYIYKSAEDDIEMYSAKKNVIYIYPADKKKLVQKALYNASQITYPQADMKGLQRNFPHYVGQYDLDDGRVMLVYSKDENMYPVGMFGKLPPAHVAWVISRLENIACVLEYNDLLHNGISVDAVFINPRTHEAALLGGWHKVTGNPTGSTADLVDIRKTAFEILELDYDERNAPIEAFLKGSPAKDAYEDFVRWDKVIENELGGRHFAKFII